MFNQGAVVWWYTVSSQSLGEKWAGWLSRGKNEGVEWLPPRKAQIPTQRPQKLPQVSTSRARNSRVAKAELSPNNNITAAREQLAREPSCLPNALSPSSSIFEDPIPSFPNLPSICHCYARRLL